ncbi:MAG: DEAD/DEAH box helicase [Promethearchaeota archaeon]
MYDLLKTLRSFDALRDNIEDRPDEIKVKSMDCMKPSFDSSNILNEVDPSINKVLLKLGIEKLYEHQASAVKLAIEGKNVVLESPTASGKTLAFTIPMVDKLLKNPKSHALLIYPMKAVANDQRRQLTDFLNHYRYLESWTYDGDTPPEDRSCIKRKPPTIILTNPEMLHLSFLGWADQWQNLLKSISFIVVDEIHEYRGYFGTNYALLLRRFLLKLSKMECYPQLFLCTATCKNPLEHAERLTGKNFNLVSAKNKMKPYRNFIFINPRNIPDFKFREIFKFRIARAALACLSLNLSTIVFCPSRKFAEDICKIAKRESEKFNLEPSVIAPYKSGIRAKKRREIEKGLREGEYKIVFTTNALELGIDIGKLDVCILAGFPESIMSAWQRIGRVGRSWDKVTHILFYAMNNAFDQFYAGNIDSFLNKPLDEITIGVGNEELISRHVPYLLNETGWDLSEKDQKIIGEDFYHYTKEKIRGIKPLKGIHGPNYLRLNIRGCSGSIFKLLYHDTEIGTISDAQAFREAYIGAIYNHFGRPYKVVSHGGNEIHLEETDPYYYTEPSFYTVVQSNDILKGERYNEEFSVFYGKLTIFENFTGYKLINERDGNILDEVRSDLSRHRYAHTFWMKFENLNSSIIISSGITALENIFRVGAPFVIPSDRHDASTFCNKSSFEIYFYENYPGGIGISEKAFYVFRKIVKEGIKIAVNCSCKEGCPRCIFPPRFKKADDLSKSAGLKLADELLEITSKPAEEVFDSSIHGWRGR